MYVRPHYQDYFQFIQYFKGLFKGSVFVTINAKRHLRSSFNLFTQATSFPLNATFIAQLANSPYLSQLEYICQEFDRKTKLGFMTTAEDQRIRFGHPSDRDDACGIRSGQIKLAGCQMFQITWPYHH